MAIEQKLLLVFFVKLYISPLLVAMNVHVS
jgi:hypothetical protein